MNILKSTFSIKQITIRRIIIAAVAALACGILSVYLTGNSIITAIGWGFIMLTAVLFPIEFDDRMPYIIRTVLLLIFTVFIFILMQNTISCGVRGLSPLLFGLNILILFGITAVFWMITKSMKISLIIMTVLSYALAVVDHVVVQARSFEIQFADLGSVGTAMSVAGGYSFDLWRETRFGIMCGVCFLAFIISTKFPRTNKQIKHYIYSAVPILLAVFCTAIVCSQALSGSLGITQKYWKFRGSELNGFWVNVMYTASATRIIEPDGYKEVDTQTPLAPTLSLEITGDGRVEKEDKPNVIVIMNETFSDVANIAEYLGYKMNTTQELLPFYNSLSNNDENIIKGHAVASVYGGNTANSEFEFLTGMSMAFLPRSTIPYSLYLNAANSFSIVDNFNLSGYKTIAIHPEDRTNWKRESVYGYYGFDETYFRDEFTDLVWEKDYYRGHVSDKAVYNKIIELYEAREAGQSLFTFAVTMQNHGGYTSTDFEYTTMLSDYSNDSINEYLTSINNSDAALKELISYFEAQDEEVIILFFGDHQPSITEIGTQYFGINDESSDLDRLAEYVVPYMFWSNKAISAEVSAVTSLNFLSGHLLDMAGVQKTEFMSYVNQISREVMALNASGWLDYNYNFTPISYAGSQALGEPLQMYSSLQYNALFDQKNKLVSLFKLTEDKSPTGDATGEAMPEELLYETQK